MTERDPDPYVMYIVVRRSLKLSAGKVGAQCGHAVQYLMQEFLPERWPTRDEAKLLSRKVAGTLTDEERTRFEALEKEKDDRYERCVTAGEWLKGDHAKIILGASDDEFMKVQLENEHFFMVVDLGYTQVAPDTETSLGLWPMRKSAASETVKTLRPL